MLGCSALLPARGAHVTCAKPSGPDAASPSKRGRTAETNARWGIRVACRKLTFPRGPIPAALPPLQLSGTAASHASTANSIGDAVAVVRPFAGLPPRHRCTCTSPHGRWAELIQLPSIRRVLGRPRTMRSKPASRSPSRGPTAVLGRKPTMPNSVGQGRRQKAVPILYPHGYRLVPTYSVVPTREPCPNREEKCQRHRDHRRVDCSGTQYVAVAAANDICNQHFTRQHAPP